MYFLYCNLQCFWDLITPYFSCFSILRWVASTRLRSMLFCNISNDVHSSEWGEEHKGKWTWPQPWTVILAKAMSTLVWIHFKIYLFYIYTVDICLAKIKLLKNPFNLTIQFSNPKFDLGFKFVKITWQNLNQHMVFKSCYCTCDESLSVYRCAVWTLLSRF